MLNTEHSYYEAGYKAGRARRQRDESRAQFHTDWFHRARGLEQPEDKDYARKLFDQGYAEGRGTV